MSKRVNASHKGFMVSSSELYITFSCGLRSHRLIKTSLGWLKYDPRDSITSISWGLARNLIWEVQRHAWGTYGIISRLHITSPEGIRSPRLIKTSPEGVCPQEMLVLRITLGSRSKKYFVLYQMDLPRAMTVGRPKRGDDSMSSLGRYRLSPNFFLSPNRSKREIRHFFNRERLGSLTNPRPLGNRDSKSTIDWVGSDIFKKNLGPIGLYKYFSLMGGRGRS